MQFGKLALYVLFIYVIYVLNHYILQAVSKKDTPHNNFFFYNGVNGNGMVDKIG